MFRLGPLCYYRFCNVRDQILFHTPCILLCCTARAGNYWGENSFFLNYGFPSFGLTIEIFWADHLDARCRYQLWFMAFPQFNLCLNGVDSLFHPKYDHHEMTQTARQSHGENPAKVQPLWQFVECSTINGVYTCFKIFIKCICTEPPRVRWGRK